jgi:hypothetical protein
VKLFLSQIHAALENRGSSVEEVKAAEGLMAFPKRLSLSEEDLRKEELLTAGIVSIFFLG